MYDDHTAHYRGSVIPLVGPVSQLSRERKQKHVNGNKVDHVTMNVLDKRRRAERNANRALADGNMVMFGLWADVWKHMNDVLNGRDRLKFPWQSMVDAAKGGVK